MPTPLARLRERLSAPGTVRVIGAHDALGARLAERAGFDGVWASSFEISASHGVPDAGILCMSEFLSSAASMAAAVDIPVVADCDSGFGNAINVIHMVRRYESAGVAAVCIEDKVFPKVNSLVSKRQQLAGLAECAGKIEAAKNAQIGSDFVVIARVEALIAGETQQEALRRAHAYADAGADAILIHDKSPSPNAIVEFCRAWDGSAPLVVVPTTYYSVAVSELSALGVKMVIYANHGLRACVRALEETFGEILRQGTTSTVEHNLAPISSIFELQGCAQLERDERNYVRTDERNVRAVIAAADRASETHLRENVAVLNSIGIRDVIVTDRHRYEALSESKVAFAAGSGDFSSVFSMQDAAGYDTLLIFGEVPIDKESLGRLLNGRADIAVLVDFKKRGSSSSPSPCATTETRNRILRIGNAMTSGSQCEFSDVALFSPRGFRVTKDACKAWRADRTNQRAISLTDVLQHLIDRGEWVLPVERCPGMPTPRTGTLLSIRPTM
ncbi:MAG: isocitrate lyase/phosphoenolpyruvate mutase family protein [Candidatus Sulfotelmatobacter sp.]|jgi:phosphoenolpyruvate phosphomutase